MTKMEHPEMKRGSSKKQKETLGQDWRRLEEDSTRLNKRGRLDEDKLDNRKENN